LETPEIIKHLQIHSPEFDVMLISSVGQRIDNDFRDVAHFDRDLISEVE